MNAVARNLKAQLDLFKIVGKQIEFEHWLMPVSLQEEICIPRRTSSGRPVHQSLNATRHAFEPESAMGVSWTEREVRSAEVAC